MSKLLAWHRLIYDEGTGELTNVALITVIAGMLEEFGNSPGRRAPVARPES